MGKAIERGQRCNACDGFTGECDKCGNSDWCLHWKEVDGEDVAECCHCSKDYTLHDFVKEPPEDDREHWYDRNEDLYV